MGSCEPLIQSLELRIYIPLPAQAKLSAQCHEKDLQLQDQFACTARQLGRKVLWFFVHFEWPVSDMKGEVVINHN
eukprot:2255822-Amphidinium_carterae.1